MSQARRLDEGLAALELDLSAGQRTCLLGYLALLKKWNRTYNLTAVRDEAEMVTQHLLDSLSISRAVQESALAGRRWADVGSGAGLPGIPLAIARPDLDMCLIEAVEKKSAFQRQAKIELGLANVNPVWSRVEDLEVGGFDVIVSRAFSSLADFVNLSGRLSAPHGQLYAMKGALPEDEMASLPQGWVVAWKTRLTVPGLDAQRHLIVLERA